MAEPFMRAVNAEWDASVASDPDLEAMTGTHTDPILQRLRDRMTTRRVLGQIARRPDDSKSRTTIESIDLNGDTAIVVDCTVDDAVVQEKASGRVVNANVVTQRRRNTLRMVDGSWKIADRTNETEWEGIAGCATT